MQVNELVSVIVPVYNVEKYLNKCIDSLINQTYKNIEILLIDDGSTDKSGKICDSLKNKYKNIKVYHKENGGLSDSRNYGIEKAKGKYVMFIDSDDYIDCDFIQKLLYSLINNNSDICSGAKKYEHYSKITIINDGDGFSLSSKETLKKMILKQDIDNSVCDKIFKKELFDNIKFPENRYYEDIATTYKLMLNSVYISHVNHVYYHYVMRSNSISKEEFNYKQFDSLLFTMQQKKDIVRIYPDLLLECNANYYLELMSTLRRINKSTNKKNFKVENKKIKKLFKVDFINIMKNPYIPIYKKIMAIFIYFNFYKLLEKIYHVLKEV